MRSLIWSGSSLLKEKSLLQKNILKTVQTKHAPQSLASWAFIVIKPITEIHGKVALKKANSELRVCY